MFTHNRRAIDLCGTWKFNPDPYQRCKQQQWWRNPSRDDSFFPCWDYEGLWDIQVPGTWKTQFPELKWYDGDANYVRNFDVPDLPNDHEAFLVFDGVVYACQVYLNGEHVADHEWGYSPFRLRVTHLLKQGGNQLFVLVENRLSKDRVPGIRFDWNNDGGIINAVRLVLVPAIHIENFRTETRLEDAEATIRVQCSVAGAQGNSGDTLPVTFEIPELNVRKAFNVPVGGSASAEVCLPCSTATQDLKPETLQLWSPDHPKLYETRLTTPHETLTDEIGYREIRREGTRLLLNGKPLRLYGVAVHSEFPGTGRTATAAGIALMVQRAKDLGCNFLRCAHYPYAEVFGRAMDRAGLLWWEEVPVYWLPTIHEAHMSRLALGMLRETIVRDWNRASLIIWSVSNECAGDGSKAGAHRDLTGGNYPYWVQACRLVRELDPSRLISSADAGHRVVSSNGWTPDAGDAFDTAIKGQDWQPGHPDAFYDLLDLLGGNLYVGKPGDNPTATDKFVDMLRRFNKPLMITEFGSMSTTESDPAKPETAVGHPKYHETILREGYRACHGHPEIVGMVPWCLMNVRVPMHWRWYNRGSGTFAYGLLDNDYKPKHVYAVVKEEIARWAEQ